MRQDPNFQTLRKFRALFDDDGSQQLLRGESPGQIDGSFRNPQRLFPLLRSNIPPVPIEIKIAVKFGLYT